MRAVVVIFAIVVTWAAQAFELRTDNAPVDQPVNAEPIKSSPPMLQRAVVPNDTTVNLPVSSSLPLDPELKTNIDRMAVIDRVEVKKSIRRMFLMSGEVVVREYRISLGPNPRGHKVQEGDNRTPEGKYYLDFVMNDSAFYRSMHISYPNLRDRRRAEELGVSAGGNIKIHGLKNGYTKPVKFIQSFDWTNGCIAITNTEMDELITLVKIGTPIYIRW